MVWEFSGIGLAGKGTEPKLMDVVEAVRPAASSRTPKSPGREVRFGWKGCVALVSE